MTITPQHLEASRPPRGGQQWQGGAALPVWAGFFILARETGEVKA